MDRGATGASANSFLLMLLVFWCVCLGFPLQTGSPVRGPAQHNSVVPGLWKPGASAVCKVQKLNR